jgi:hypothetical protein
MAIAWRELAHFGDLVLGLQIAVELVDTQLPRDGRLVAVATDEPGAQTP